MFGEVIGLVQPGSAGRGDGNAAAVEDFNNAVVV